MLQEISRRLLRVIRLDAAVYPEIAEDERATGQAALVVAVATGLAALGSAVTAPAPVAAFLRQWLAGVLLGWLGWTALVVLVGNHFFGGQARFAEAARALGFALAPTVLGILSVFGCLGLLATVGAWLLPLVSGYLATREVLRLSSERAALTVIVSWLLVLGAQVAVLLLAGPIT